jgi:hypothetical protein
MIVSAVRCIRFNRIALALKSQVSRGIRASKYASMETEGSIILKEALYFRNDAALERNRPAVPSN